MKCFRSQAIGLNASRVCIFPRYFPAKTEECPSDIPNFQNCACCEKYLKDNNTIVSF